MLLGFGVACALLEAARSGRGQVVDAAMVEGASLLAAMFAGFLKAGTWSEARGENILDTGAPWYNVYETKDRKYVSIGSIETRFYEELLQKLGVKDLGQHDRARWPEMRRFRKTSDRRPATMCRGSKAHYPASPVCRVRVASHAHNVSRRASLIWRGQQHRRHRVSRTPGGAAAARRAKRRRGACEWFYLRDRQAEGARRCAELLLRSEAHFPSCSTRTGHIVGHRSSQRCSRVRLESHAQNIARDHARTGDPEWCALNRDSDALRPRPDSALINNMDDILDLTQDFASRRALRPEAHPPEPRVAEICRMSCERVQSPWPLAT